MAYALMCLVMNTVATCVTIQTRTWWMLPVNIVGIGLGFHLVRKAS